MIYEVETWTLNMGEQTLFLTQDQLKELNAELRNSLDDEYIIEVVGVVNQLH